jgi:hypothetical protein
MYFSPLGVAFTKKIVAKSPAPRLLFLVGVGIRPKKGIAKKKQHLNKWCCFFLKMVVLFDWYYLPNFKFLPG